MTGAALLDLAECDRTFDLFDPAGESPSLEAWLRPAVVGADGRLIWGFRYQHLWHTRREYPFAVLRLTVPDLSVESLATALTAEGRRDRYRFSEMARVLARAAEFSDGDAPVTDPRLASLLTSDGDPTPVVRRYRALPPVIATAVDNGEIDLATGEMVPSDLGAAAAAILPLLRDVSFSTRRQAFRMAVDCFRGGAAPTELTAQLSAVPRDERLGYLRRCRYPRLTELETRFAAIRDRHTRGTGVRLEPPKNFEGDRFAVSFSFRNREELRRRRGALAGIEDEIDGLLDLLF